jgi:basic amino acid/polyamine antiporter, APA family
LLTIDAKGGPGPPPPAQRDGGGDRPLIGSWQAGALVAGAMLGVGIFVAPPEVAAHARTPGSFFAIWAAGAVAALCGAICVAELGAMLPRSGGHYVYLREAYGPGIAFAVGWLQVLAIFPGAVASFQLPALFGDAASAPIRLFGFELSGAFFLGALVIVGFTAVNHLGIEPSTRVELALVAAPIVVLALATILVLGALAAGSRAAERAGPPAGVDAYALAAAYLPVYFAYSGWDAALYVAGEVRAPALTLPRAVVGGTLVVATLYLLLCAGFVAVLPLDRLAEVSDAGAAVASRVFGRPGVVTMTSLVLLASLASLNGTVLAGSRIAGAMARNRDFFAFAARVSPRTGAPAAALWLQALVSLALLATQRFDQLLAYTTTAMLVTGTLSVGAVAVLRRTRPDLPRPYRAALYPLTPALYVCGNVVALALLARRRDASTLLALGWFAAALVAHRLVRMRRA